MKYTPEEIESILDRVTGLMDEYENADKKYRDDQDKAHWNDTYGERLGAYGDKLKSLNGDDFDIVDAARQEYNSDYSDMSQDEYVNALEENIKKTIARIWPDVPKEEAEAAASEIAENAGEPSENEEGVLDVTEVGKDIASTSDSDEKKPSDEMKVMDEANNKHPGRDGIKFWGNPSKSGGRNGSTSDEDEKEPSAEDKFIRELELYKENLPKRK